MGGKKHSPAAPFRGNSPPPPPAPLPSGERATHSVIFSLFISLLPDLAWEPTNLFIFKKKLVSFCR